MRLSFDMNVALRGGCAEVQAQREASEEAQMAARRGRVTDRRQAASVLRTARENVVEMEAERKKRSG